MDIDIKGTSYNSCEETFIETIHFQNASEKIHITPLCNSGLVEWFQVIFESGDKRFIEQGLWGWKFLDQVPEPEDEENLEADADLELATKVGEAIETYYDVQ